MSKRGETTTRHNTRPPDGRQLAIGIRHIRTNWWTNRVHEKIHICRCKRDAAASELQCPIEGAGSEKIVKNTPKCHQIGLRFGTGVFRISCRLPRSSSSSEDFVIVSLSGGLATSTTITKTRLATQPLLPSFASALSLSLLQEMEAQFPSITKVQKKQASKEEE